MNEEIVKKFLQFPYTPIVDTLVKMANLRTKEQEIINLCVCKGMTQAEVAEHIDISISSVWRYYKNGMKKLCKAWGGIWWLPILVEENEKKGTL